MSRTRCGIRSQYLTAPSRSFTVIAVSDAAGSHPGSRNQGIKSMSEESEDFTAMGDPEFLAERSRVRDELENAPRQAAKAELAARYRRLDDEFIRRARMAWTAKAGGGD